MSSPRPIRTWASAGPNGRFRLQHTDFARRCQRFTAISDSQAEAITVRFPRPSSGMDKAVGFRHEKMDYARGRCRLMAASQRKSNSFNGVCRFLAYLFRLCGERSAAEQGL